MEITKVEFTYQVYDQKELPLKANLLFEETKEALSLSWSPYSNFQVGAAILLDNGQVLMGANQENAAYPMCLCAERVVLAAAASQFPGIKIEGMCILARFREQEHLHPISPCGACRQVLLETERRQGIPLPLYLGGKENTIIHLSHTEILLPLSFGGLGPNIFPIQK